jgi:hypothetical protein
MTMTQPQRDWRDELARQVFSMAEYAAAQTPERHDPALDPLHGPAPARYRCDGWKRAIEIITGAFTRHGEFGCRLGHEFPLVAGGRTPRQMLEWLEQQLKAEAGLRWDLYFFSAEYALAAAADMVHGVIQTCLCEHAFERQTWAEYGYELSEPVCRLCGAGPAETAAVAEGAADA